MVEDRIHIALAVDRNFVQHCAACLASIFYNTPKANFCIHIISDDAEIKGLQKLRKFVKSHGHDLLFYHFDKNLIQAFKISLHVTHATYYRLFIPKLIQVTNKIIYLDSDIIALRSIEDLWMINLSDHILAATYPDEHHFNAGALLLNLERWRKEGITEKCVNWIKQNNESIQYWDQDALNNVIPKQEIIPLPKKWNWTESKEISFNQKIHLIHFVGTHKPWNYYCEHSMKGEYYKYLRLTPWRNYKPLQETKWYRLMRKIKKVVKYFTK